MSNPVPVYQETTYMPKSLSLQTSITEDNIQSGYIHEYKSINQYIGESEKTVKILNHDPTSDRQIYRHILALSAMSGVREREGLSDRAGMYGIDQ